MLSKSSASRDGTGRMPLADNLAALRSTGGHRTLAERAFATLHEAIVTGVLSPGERLPIEELADVLEMSPMPIREALRQLDSVGLVENVPHRGARVTELSIDDLREVYEARLELEALAVRHAAQKFTEADAAVARERLEEHVKAYSSRDVRRIWESHTEFHFAIYNAAHSRWMNRLIKPLWETSERYRFAMLPVRQNLDRRRLEHEHILDACANHDEDLAVAELRNHLTRTANLIAGQMGGEDLFELVELPKPRAAAR
ncbi:MAG: GntR family transcriptional regulator [Solirubrobacteraceae bacterium]